MINIKIAIKEQENETTLNIESPGFVFDFSYDTREEAAFNALKFLSDFGILQQFTNEEKETPVVKVREKIVPPVKPALVPVPTSVPAAPSALGEDYIDIKQTAEELGLAVASIYNFISQEIFPPADQKYKGRNYWLKTTIAAFKASKPASRKKKVIEAPEEEEIEDDLPLDPPELELDPDEEQENINNELKAFIRTL